VAIRQQYVLDHKRTTFLPFQLTDTYYALMAALQQYSVLLLKRGSLVSPRQLLCQSFDTELHSRQRGTIDYAYIANIEARRDQLFFQNLSFVASPLRFFVSPYFEAQKNRHKMQAFG
jgi:hypothetical protein